MRFLIVSTFSDALLNGSTCDLGDVDPTVSGYKNSTFNFRFFLSSFDPVAHS